MWRWVRVGCAVWFVERVSFFLSIVVVFRKEFPKPCREFRKTVMVIESSEINTLEKVPFSLLSFLLGRQKK